MYINDKFHHKEWLDIDVFEEVFFESKFQILLRKCFGNLYTEN